jgi:FkbM family methyltransferase
MAVLHLKQWWKDLVFNFSASDNLLYKLYYRHIFKPKPGTLHEFVYQVADEYANVTFIQVGANDGYFHDPLHFMIKKHRWKGIVLEPSEGVIAINAALDYQDGEKEIYKISFSQSRWATGLASFNKSVLERAVQSGHIARCAKRYNEELPSRVEDYIKGEKIVCISAKTLLEKYRLDKIDWLQIDAEGYDFEIIKMMQINQTHPSVITFEHSHLSKEDYDACVQHLQKNGYAVKRIRENTVAMKYSLPFVKKFFND